MGTADQWRTIDPSCNETRDAVEVTRLLSMRSVPSWGRRSTRSVGIRGRAGSSGV